MAISFVVQPTVSKTEKKKIPVSQDDPSRRRRSACRVNVDVHLGRWTLVTLTHWTFSFQFVEQIWFQGRKKHILSMSATKIILLLLRRRRRLFPLKVHQEFCCYEEPLV